MSPNSTVIRMNHESHHYYPDRGYAWIIVLCGFILYLIVDGIAYNLGLINSAWLTEFKESETATSWIGSIFYSVPLLCAPITAQLVERFGCKAITIVCGLISTFGFVLSSLCTSIVQLYITVGLIAGFGVSAAYIVGILSVERWFEHRRTLGIGIVSAGTGFGTFIFPPVTQFLLNVCGWRVTMLFLAGLVTIMSFVGCFIIEPHWMSGERVKANENFTELNESKVIKVLKKMSKLVSHFKNFNFVLLAISTFAIYALYNIPIYFIVELLKNYDYTEAECANFLSLIGIFLMFGMITLGYIGDISGDEIIKINAVCVLICGISEAMMPTLAENFITFGICCAFFGFTFASAYVLIPKIAELIVGVEQFPSALGLNFFVQGVGLLIGTPFGSLLFEYFDNWKISFEICGFLIAISSIFALLIKVRR